MAGSRVKLNLRGFRELRNDPAVVELVEKQAEQIARNAGAGFETSVHKGGTRARVTVFPATDEAFRAEAKTGALSKAVGGG